MTRLLTRATLVALLGASLALIVPVAPTASTSAALPGPQGRLAFTSDRSGDFDIWSVDPDGTDPVNLTQSPGADDWAAWSPDGTRIAFTSRRDGNADIYVMNADGTGQANLTAQPGEQSDPVWSPDGGSIAFVDELAGGPAVRVMPARGFGDGSRVRTVTASARGVSHPAWSPDGKRLAFTSGSSGDWEIWTVAADGSDPVRLTDSPGLDVYPAWSPDGNEIAFRSTRGDSLGGLWKVASEGGTATRVTPAGEPAFETDPTFSPDGKQVAFGRQTSGLAEIYVREIDGNGLRNVSNNPARDFHPAWQVWWQEQVGFSTVEESKDDASKVGDDCPRVGPATGGAASTRLPVTVSNKDEFVDFATREDPFVILVKDTIDLRATTVNVASNKTIRGIGEDAAVVEGSLRLQDVCNVIIQNLRLKAHKVEGAGKEGEDVVSLLGYTYRVWVDHNDFDTDCDDSNDCSGYDGQLDIKEQADLVTVSWNRFEQHDKVSLVGVTGKGVENRDRGAQNLRVTMHHNVFRAVNQRTPSFAFGTLHAFDNRWQTVRAGIHCRAGAACLVEYNTFVDTTEIFRTDDSDKGDIGGSIDLSAAPLVRPKKRSFDNPAFNTNVKDHASAWYSPSDGELDYKDVDARELGYSYVHVLETDPAARFGTLKRFGGRGPVAGRLG